MSTNHPHTVSNLPTELKTLQRRLIRSEKAARWLKFEGNGITIDCQGFKDLVLNLLDGRELLAEDLIGSPAEWQRIRRDVLRAKSQHGVNTLALGLAKVYWMDHRQIVLESPLFVLDVQLEPVRFFGAKSKLIPSDILRLNPLMQSWIERQMGIDISESVEVKDGVAAAIEELIVLLPAIAFDAEVVSLRSWKIVRNTAVLDRFSDPGIALYHAYDGVAPDEWKRIQEPTLDQSAISENDIFSGFPVLPFDGSQARAILSASTGEQFLLQGPPGTGKSQTIANMVANAVAQGKQVAVVSTKQAALDAVHHRLTACGLGHLVLRCNDLKTDMPNIVKHWRDSIAVLNDENALNVQQIQASRKTAESKMAGQLLVLDQRQKSLRADLEHLNEILKKRKAIKLPFPISGTLSGIPDYPMWKAMQPMLELTRNVSTGAGIQSPSDIVAFFLNPLVLSVPEKLPEMIDSLHSDLIMLDGLIAQSGELTLAEVGTALHQYQLKNKLATKGIRYNSRYAAALLKADAQLRSKSAKLVNTLAQIGGVFLNLSQAEAEAVLQQMQEKPKWWKRRSHAHSKLITAVRNVNAHTKVNLGVQQVLELHLKALDYQLDVTAAEQKLLSLCNECAVEEIVMVVKTLQSFEHAPELGIKPYFSDVFDRWRHHLNLLMRDVGVLTIQQIVERISRLQDNIIVLLQLAPVLSEMHRNAVQVFDFLKRFPSDWIAAEATVLDYALQRRLAMAGSAGQISGNTLEVMTMQMQQGMDEWLKSNAQYIQARQQQNWQTQIRLVAMSSSSLKPDLRAKRRKLVFAHRMLRKTVQRKQRFVSLRELSHQGMLPVLETLSPITIATPEVLVEAFFGLRTFDLIVFDEAGIVPLESAVPCMVIANQSIVSGDPMQMTPSSYFVSKSEDDNLPETLLDWCAETRSVRPLNWHYRSRYQKLIDWCNKWFYEGKLNTVPSPDEDEIHPIQVHQVKGAYSNGVNCAEAEMVALQVRRMMVEYGKTSILVVAMSTAQSEQIESSLALLSANDPYFDLLLEQAVLSVDGLMIRTIEHLQGDERDHVIISVGYGPDESGKLRLLMGSLVREGGERRLNVLFSRARLSMDVFCSFSPKELPISDNPGIHHLRSFLTRKKNERVPQDLGVHNDTIVLNDAMVFEEFSAISYVFVLLPLLKKKGWKVQQNTLPDMLTA